jgi:hypothetical protein
MGDFRYQCGAVVFLFFVTPALFIGVANSGGI